MSKLVINTKEKNVKHSNSYNVDSIYKEIASGITGVVVFILLALFPLYTRRAYFDILTARYGAYRIIVIVHLILLFILSIIYLINVNSNTDIKGGALNRLSEAIMPKNIGKYITLTDVFFVIMIIGCCISTMYAKRYSGEAFYGNAGRYQGLECWLLYFVSYIMISRTFEYKKWYLDFALICGFIVSVWGITDFFQLNIFNFFDGVQEHQKFQFASTVGNLNTFTNYTAMVFALGAGLFMVEKNTLKSIFYAVMTLGCSLGSVFGLSDNTILSYAGFFIFAPFFLIKDRRSVVRFFYVASIFFFGIFAMYVACTYTTGYNTMTSIFKTLSNIEIMRYAFIPFLFVGIFLNIFWNAKNNNSLNNGNTLSIDMPVSKYVVRLWGIFVLILIAVTVLIVLDVNVFKKHDEFWQKTTFYRELLFNDDWGTHRGHNWRIAFTNFIERFDWMRRIFGYGPDTYLIVTERSFYEEMVNRYREIYDSAHNEYINYLICEGVIGLISYLGIFISALVYAYKIRKENNASNILALVVISYMTQAIINIAIPITTPVFFVSMYIIVNIYLKSEERKKYIGTL